MGEADDAFVLDSDLMWLHASGVRPTNEMGLRPVGENPFLASFG